jgi:proteasome lid subunit RPN8/RPN11
VGDPVKIPRHAYEQIIDYSIGEARANGREACGYLLGKGSDDDPDSFMILENVAEHPRYRFEFDPETWLRHNTWLDAARLKPMAIWHSHIGTSAEPSEHDIRNAVDPNLLHLIVSVPMPGTSLPVREGVPTVLLWKLSSDGPVNTQAVPQPLVVW